jgi:hypothetical protein
MVKFKLRPTNTTARMDLYVREDGDDRSIFGSEKHPLRTLEEAESRIPDIVNHPVVIHLGYSATKWPWPTFQSRILRDHIVVIGDGAGDPMYDGFQVITPSTAALAGSDKYVVKSSGLDTDAYWGDGVPLSRGVLFGKTIEILSGAAKGDRRTIWKNTETDIIPAVPFTFPVVEGDRYRIVVPSIHVIVPDWGKNSACQELVSGNLERSAWFYSEFAPALCLVNLFLNGDSYSEFANLFGYGAKFLLLGVRFDESLALGADIRSGFEIGYISGSGSAYGYAEGTPLGKRIFDAPSDLSWAGWGTGGDLDSTAQVVGVSSGIFKGLLCTGSLYVGQEALVVMNAGALFGNGLYVRSFNPDSNSFVSVSAYGTKIDIRGSNAVQAAGPMSANIETSYEGTIDITGCYTSILMSGLPKVELRLFDDKTIRLATVNATASNGCIKSGKAGGSLLVSGYGLPDCQPAVAGNDFTVDGGATYRPISALVSGSFFKAVRAAQSDGEYCSVRRGEV